MAEDWISSLDFCAANGLFNYDAAAFVLDKPQRYVGNPKSDQIGNLPPLMQNVPNINKTPTKDTFENGKTPTWKKALLGFSALALLIAGAVAFKKGKLSLGSIKNFKFKNIKDKFSNISFEKIKNKFSSFKWEKIKNKFSSMSEYFKNFFKKESSEYVAFEEIIE